MRGTPCSQIFPLSCHHMQKFLGFSIPQQIFLADFALLLGTALPNLLAYALLSALLMILLEEHLYYLLEPPCPVI